MTERIKPPSWPQRRFTTHIHFVYEQTLYYTLPVQAQSLELQGAIYKYIIRIIYERIVVVHSSPRRNPTPLLVIPAASPTLFLDVRIIRVLGVAAAADVFGV